MTMSDEAEMEEGDQLALSFVDVLSGALGASVFLFILFAIMPHLGAIVTREMAVCAEDCGRGGLTPIALGNLDRSRFQEMPIIISAVARCEVPLATVDASANACAAGNGETIQWRGPGTSVDRAPDPAMDQAAEQEPETEAGTIRPPILSTSEVEGQCANMASDEEADCSQLRVCQVQESLITSTPVLGEMTTPIIVTLSAFLPATDQEGQACIGQVRLNAGNLRLTTELFDIPPGEEREVEIRRVDTALELAVVELADLADE